MLYFVRHGESQANVDQIFVGPKLAAPLTKKGIDQAKAEGKSLLDKRIVINHIISSPLERALHTAQIIAETIGYSVDKIQIDERLAEYDMGSLAGMSYSAVDKIDMTSYPGAEDVLLFQERVIAGIKAAKALSGNTLIVSHGGVGSMLEATKRKLDPFKFNDVESYPNARVILLD